MYFSTSKFGIHGNKQTHFGILHPPNLISYILSNRHEIFTLAPLIILLKRAVSIFGYQL